MATSTACPSERSSHGYELRPELLAHARRILGRDSEMAEDIVQEAFVHLLRRTGEGNAPHAPRPWLYTVVSSLCIREQARARRQQPAELERLAAPAADPAELAQLRAEMRWALESVAALPEREQASLIADVAGVAQGREGANARYQALHRARRKLRTLRSGAWALFPFPFIRWPQLFGAGPASAAAGSGGAPAAIAAGGIVKGAIVAAAAVVALAGGREVVASMPATGTQPAPPGRAVAATQAQPAGPGTGPAPPAGQQAPLRDRLVFPRAVHGMRSATGGEGPSLTGAPGLGSPAPGGESPSAAAPSADRVPSQHAESASPSRDDPPASAKPAEDVDVDDEAPTPDEDDASESAEPGDDLEEEVEAPAPEEDDAADVAQTAEGDPDAGGLDEEPED